MELDDALERQRQAEMELEQSIEKLIRECWRLSLPVHYEPTTPELETLIIGKDQ